MTDEIVRATLEHVMLVLASVGIATAVGVPVGVALTRRTAWQRPVLAAANVVQTIPSLALFGLLIPLPVFGIGTRTALFALTLYALLPILRNTVTGIASIDPAMREAAVGMGMTDRQLLRRVELPLAAGVILAGVRVATVIGIGLAVIAAPIGAGGLGTLVFSGVASLDNRRILAGAIPSALMALVADAVLGVVERRMRWPR
jgi:osmoprotectant transport system permease protein